MELQAMHLQRGPLIFPVQVAVGICWILLSSRGASVSADDTAVAIEPRASSRAPGNRADRIGSHMRVDSNLVLVPVTVTDRQDQLVTGLEKKHFRLFEDKIERPIQQFAIEDAPVSVIV